MSAIWPSAVASTLQMLLAINNTKVTLNVAAGIGDTTLTVDDVSPLSTSGYLTVDDNADNPETISYTGKSGNNLTGITRGADGTAAGTHSSGAHLEMRWNAAYHNTLATELIAVEQNLSDRFGTGTAIVIPSGIAYTIASTPDFFNTTTAFRILSSSGNFFVVKATAIAVASRNLTIPDPGTNANLVLSESAQTINGALTLTSALTITPTTNQIVLGTSRTVTISATQPASSSRTYTIPDCGAAAAFVMTQSTQTIVGATTFSAVIAASAGATFGNIASPSSTTLDYYSEGTFTPVLAFGGASVGITYTIQTGRYTRIGRFVQYEIRIVLSSKGSSTGSATITGLPFTAGSRAYAAAYVDAMASGVLYPAAEIDTTTCFLAKVTTGAIASISNTDFTNTTTFEFTGSFSV